MATEVGFSQEEVQNLMKETVDNVLGTSGYQHSQVNQWTSSIVEQTLAQLTKLNRPFKYIVTCCVMQKNGAGLHLASSCYWDNTTDVEAHLTDANIKQKQISADEYSSIIVKIQN